MSRWSTFRRPLLARAGEPRVLVYPRSAFKPFQALPLVESSAFARSGLGPDALALIAGSHSGTDAHVALVRDILEAAGAGTGTSSAARTRPTTSRPPPP